MGMFTDLVTNAKSFTSSSRVGQFLTDLATRYDPADDSAFGATDAVHTVAQFDSDPTGGTFTLTISLRNLPPFTTAGIAHNANAATIESAIDTAATSAAVPGWTNGDITVAGGTLLAAGADVTLTYDGTSVAAEEHTLVTIDGASLTGGGLASPATVKTTAGQTLRRARQALKELGVISESTPPSQVTSVAATAGSNLLQVKPAIVMELAQECAFEDGNAETYYDIMDAILTEHEKSTLMPR